MIAGGECSAQKFCEGTTARESHPTDVPAMLAESVVKITVTRKVHRNYLIVAAITVDNCACVGQHKVQTWDSCQ